jgi:hypothetical protein
MGLRSVGRRQGEVESKGRKGTWVTKVMALEHLHPGFLNA